MKNAYRKIFSLAMAMIMALAVSTSAFAASPIVLNENGTESEVMPLATTHQLVMGVGTSKTSHETSRLYSLFTTATSVRMNCTVSGPCTIFFYIKDGSGNVLGSNSMTFVGAQTVTWGVTPSTLGYGAHSIEWWFDRDGVTYTFQLLGDY